MTAHIDTLAEWYESAERITKTNLPGDGDFIICPYIGGIGYIIERSTGGWASNIVLPDETCRILARAPKPKPAWHDAVAVMARCSNAPEGHREPFIRSEATRDVWAGEAGHARTEDLRDVTPLIEAKVTDEMVARAMKFWDPNCPGEHDADDIQWAREFITAALGLETE